MDADWSVELGADDPALEFPWSSPDGSQRYIDLHDRSELVSEIPEAVHYSEMAEFLRAINGTQSSWLTVKCDVWLDDELGAAEAIYDATLKQCSYVDLIARDTAAPFSFERHERWVKSAARSLSNDDELPLACEFIVRRCWYHCNTLTGENAAVDETDSTSPAPGFYVTFYLSGYGNNHDEARARWFEGLRRVTAVLVALTV